MSMRGTKRASSVAVFVVLGLAFAAGTAAAQNMDNGTFDSGDIGGGGGDGAVEGATQVLDPPWTPTSFGSSVDANGGTTAGTTLIADDWAELKAGTWHFQDGTWSHTHTFAYDCPTGGNDVSDSQGVSIDGDTAAIAQTSCFDNSNAGIEVYTRSSVGEWTKTDHLDVEAANVEIDFPYIAYGHPNGHSSGYVGVFRHESDGSWTQVNGGHLDGGGDIGASVALQDTTDEPLAAFGNPGADVVQVWRGDALADTWSQVQRIENSCGTLDPACPVTFGEHVDIAPTTEHKLIAGAPYANDNDGDDNFNEGDAYTFLDTGGYDDPYAFEANLTPDDDENDLWFGETANAWDGSSIVGAPGWNSGDGTVYVYDAGSQKIQLLPENPGGSFGSAVHYAGDYALVGASEKGSEGYVGYFN